MAQSGAHDVGDVSQPGIDGVAYLSLSFPADHVWTRYNSLQQLPYCITVFIAAPTSIFTVLMQSPAISNRPDDAWRQWLTSLRSQAVRW